MQTPSDDASSESQIDAAQAQAQADPDGRLPAAAVRAGATVLALLALFQAIGGLYRLADYGLARRAATDGAHWAIAFAPPAWLVLVLVAGLALLALVLLWRVADHAAARLLALFAALLANGYGVIATAGSSPLFDGTLALMRRLRAWGFGEAGLRALGGMAAALERVLWIGAWPLAGAVAVLFVRRVLRLPPPAAPSRAAEALLLLWSFVLAATLPPASAGVTGVAVVTLAGLCGLAAWQERRRSPALPVWGVVLSLLLAGAAMLPPADTVVAIACAALAALPWLRAGVRRAGPVRPALLAVLPGLLSVSTLLGGGGAAAVAPALVLALAWVAVCLLVLMATVAGAAGRLPAPGRRQALCFLSGWVAAAVAVACWAAAVLVARPAGCEPAAPGALCYLVRFQDWFLLAPMPLLLAGFVGGLLHRGEIDAARLFRRTVVYGSLLMLTLFTLGVSDALLGDFVRQGLPSETPPLVATGLLAVVLYPAKRACDRGAERLLARVLAWTDREDAPPSA